MIRRLLALISLLVPRDARARWREEWLAETRAVRTTRGRMAAVRMLLGAVPDTLALRRCVGSDGPARHRSPFHGLGQDVRYGVRSLLQAPGFSLSVIGSLAIGMAVTAAAFTFLNATIFRPFPGVRDQDRLVNVALARGCGWPNCEIRSSSLQDYRDLREGLTLLDGGLAAKANAAIAVTIRGRAHSLRASMVSENYFDVLGARAALGRTFAPGESEPAHADAVVIGHSLWQREFAADPGVLGSFVELASGSAQIIGVAPPHFVGASRYDLGVGGPGIEIWVPLVLADRLSASDERHPAGMPLDNEREIAYMGRLRDGVHSTQLSAQAEAVATGIAAARPSERAGASVRISGVWLNRQPPAMVAIVLAVPGLVLAIACLNAANLLLARGSHRASELAVRLALGATRWRIVRQLLVDSVLLSLLAAAVSLPLAQWSVSFGTIFFGLPMPVDGRVLAFTMSIAVLSGLAFSLAPALRMSAAKPGAALGSSRPGDENPRQARGRRALVIAQVALSLGLLAVGTQLITFIKAAAPSAGTEADRLLMASFDVGQLGLDDGDSRMFYRELLRRVADRPEADGVGLARRATLWTFGGGKGNSPIIVWRPEDSPRQGTMYLGGYVAGDLFRAAGLRLVQGRAFTTADEGERPRVAIVNVPLAAKLFGGPPAVGRTIRVAARGQKASEAVEVTIVGVVEASREPEYSLEPVPSAYVPVPLGPEPKLTLYARSAGPTPALADAMRTVVAEINPRLPPFEISTLEAIGGQRVLAGTVFARALTIVGVIALLLATAGLYGVTSYSVTLRSREIGVRLALGAEPAAVLRMVLTQGLRLAAIGAAIGGFAAVLISKVVRTQIRGAQGLDLWLLLGSFLVLAAAMVLATSVPARRAARVDPITVLRQE